LRSDGLHGLHGRKAVAFQSPDVKLHHALPFVRKLLARFVGCARRMTQQVVAELGPLRSRRIAAGVVQLHWLHLRMQP
jgi:hypothetical protein